MTSGMEHNVADEIVISGISCRLPESDNMQEFRDNLVNGVDMVTEDDRRWKPGTFQMQTVEGYFVCVCVC